MTEKIKEFFETEFKKFMESLKGDFTKLAENAVCELYEKYLPFVADDTESNARLAAQHALSAWLNGDYQNSVFFDFTGYSVKTMRRKILEDHRDEIIKAINADLLEENKNLKLRIKALTERF